MLSPKLQYCHYKSIPGMLISYLFFFLRFDLRYMRLVVLYDAKVDALFDCLLRCNKDMHFLMLFERKRAQF